MCNLSKEIDDMKKFRKVLEVGSLDEEIKKEDENKFAVLLSSLKNNSTKNNNITFDIEDDVLSLKITNEEVAEFFWTIDNAMNESMLNVMCEDAYMSIWAEEASSLIKLTRNTSLDEKLRIYFNSITDLPIYENELITDYTLDTNKYLKEIESFVEFTLLKSKSRSLNLLNRFNGFNLVDSESSKKGELAVYYNYFQDMQLFLNTIRENQSGKIDNSKKSLYFLDKYTNYLDVFLLSELFHTDNPYIREENIKKLLSLNAPSSKSCFLNIDNSSLLEKNNLIEIYILLFEEVKHALSETIKAHYPLYKEKETKINYQLRIYSNLNSKFNDLPYYEELIEYLINKFSVNDEVDTGNLLFDDTIKEIVLLAEQNGLKKAYQTVYNYQKEIKNTK